MSSSPGTAADSSFSGAWFLGAREGRAGQRLRIESGSERSVSRIGDPMRDDDKLLNLPDLEFGSGVVGVCDICGTRQAVIVLQKERFKLCVIDFLNKAWVRTDRKPGAPLPPYRSERTAFETEAVPSHTAPAIVLTPTKVVRHPGVLICPELFGITTTLLDAAIRFAREGFEVFVPDVGKTTGIGLSHHVSLHAGALARRGVSAESRTARQLIQLYKDALAALRARELVDATKTAVFGTSLGASLALALAAQDQKLTAVALAYPEPTLPRGLARLVSAPMLYVGGSLDRKGETARAQIEAAGASTGVTVEALTLPGVRSGFLARDLPTYELRSAETAWAEIQGFLKRRLMPPPPKPPAPPMRTAPPAPAVATLAPAVPPRAMPSPAGSGSSPKPAGTAAR